MIQISNQHSAVVHEFERQLVREVKTSHADRNAQAFSERTDDHPNQLPDKAAFDVTLTPAQIVKQKLIESLNNDHSTVLKRNSETELDTMALPVLTDSNQFLFLSDNQKVDGTPSFSVFESLNEHERLDYRTQFQFNENNNEPLTLNLSLTYERSLHIERHLQLTLSQLKDPLVINLDNKSELFSKELTLFDLDGDGDREMIPELKNGVWYLAYDQNQNGKIDNGLELFGAKSGNGFQELSVFDSNQNGLIEPNDHLFSHLQIWDGNKHIDFLRERGIKAISLNASDSPFTFTDNQGQAKAQIRQTAVFITESHKVGAIHQVDLAV